MHQVLVRRVHFGQAGRQLVAPGECNGVRHQADDGRIVGRVVVERLAGLAKEIEAFAERYGNLECFVGGPHRGDLSGLVQASTCARVPLTVFSQAHRLRTMNQRTIHPEGMLIAVEGIDGAGKTTVASHLAQFCGERGILCMISKEPTSNKYGQELRNSAAAGRLTLDREIELFELDRQDHIERSIRPALQSGSVVILDRYYWSTAAYQGARGADVEKILARNEAFAIQPDMWLLLECAPLTGIRRIQHRGDRPNHFESAENLEAAAKIFASLAAAATSRNQVVYQLDGELPLKQVIKEALLCFKRQCAEKIARRGLGIDTLNDVMMLLGADPIEETEEAEA